MLEVACRVVSRVLTYVGYDLCRPHCTYCILFLRICVLLDWFGVLKPEFVPECGGLIRRRHEGGSERGRGRMHTEGAVRDRRLDNEQTSTSDMHSDTSEY